MSRAATGPATPMELFHLRRWFSHFHPRLPMLLPQIYEAADPEGKICTWRGPLGEGAVPTPEGLQRMGVAKALQRVAWLLWHFSRTGRFSCRAYEIAESERDLWGECIARYDARHAGQEASS